MRALNFGSLNLDYVYAVDHFVRPGETLAARSQALNPGGKGLNQSIALARAGAEVSHAGCLGQGGGMLRALLAENGVDVSHLRDVDSLQGNAVIQVNPQGENCILLFGGSNRQVTPEQIAETVSAFEPGDWLILQNEINNLPLIVDAAWRRGLRIALNPSPCDEKLRDVDFGKLSWLLVNEVEAAQLCGSDEPAEAWERLHGQYPELSLLVTLGGAGSVAFQAAAGEVIRASHPAFPVRAVDTTAAGDTYTGFFVAGLMEGRPLGECMRRASMAAGISVTRPGAAPSIPTREETESALAQAGR